MTINKHLRVLAINGGGIRGYMPAMLLKHISDMSDKEIPELFDVIIGTSVGGILASAYTMPAEFGNYDRGNVKYNALQVLNLLLDNKDMIFSTRDGSIFDGPLFNRDTLDQFLAEKIKLVLLIEFLIEFLDPRQLAFRLFLTQRSKLIQNLCG